MTLPPQEPPRGPPPLKVSQKSHKIKKQPPRSSAGASQSHHPPAPPPWEDHLASLEQQLMSNDGLEEMPQLPDDLLQLENLLTPPPGLVSKMSDTDRLNEFLRAGTDEEELQREAFWEQIRMLKEREKMQQQNPLPPNQPVNFPPAPTAAAASHFLPRTPEFFPARASTFFPNPPPPPQDYLPPTTAAAAWRSILQGPPGYFRPEPSGSLPYIPPPDAAAGRSILHGPPGYFPDKSGSFLPRKPIISPAAGTSFLLRPPDISAAGAARSICPRPAECSPSAPSASSEYSPSASSSTARLQPESSPDGSCSPLTVAEVESYYGPPGYFPDNSSSFFFPLPLSEYSPSAASLLPESSLDGTFSPDSTKQPPPPPPDPTA